MRRKVSEKPVENIVEGLNEQLVPELHSRALWATVGKDSPGEIESNRRHAKAWLATCYKVNTEAVTVQQPALAPKRGRSTTRSGPLP